MLRCGPGGGLALGDVGGGRHVSLVELPAELLVKILQYIPFKDHAYIRLVSYFLE